MHFGGLEAIVILVIILLLFGSTKLPGLAKSAGQSVKIFKASMKDGEDSEDKEESDDEASS